VEKSNNLQTKEIMMYPVSFKGWTNTGWIGL